MTINNDKQLSTETGVIRNEQGKFIKGVSGNLKGRKPDSLKTKAVKQLVKEYKHALDSDLPEIRPVLRDKALAGDIQAIKEIHDVVGAHEVKGNTAIAADQINFQSDREEFSK